MEQLLNVFKVLTGNVKKVKVDGREYHKEFINMATFTDRIKLLEKVGNRYRYSHKFSNYWTSINYDARTREMEIEYTNIFSWEKKRPVTVDQLLMK